MSENITIKDIYEGKPDAKDEIDYQGIEDFVNGFVLPEIINIENLTKGTKYFITGYKGTGKTALLFYLEYLLKKEDPCSCTSFVFFKDEFTETKKQELEGFSKRIVSSITFDNEVFLKNSDFEYIWRWLFFKRIVSDNEEYSNNLFVQDSAWENFKNIVDQIKAPTDKKKSVIPPKIKIAVPFKDLAMQTEVGPELEVDFRKNEKDDYNYSAFVSLLDSAEKCLVNLTRTDIPYYIFVDELEAYYGNMEVFKRDLCFIRDLLFTVKRLNGILTKIDSKTRILCSARTEIINAISRFTISKELNKVTGGFEVVLNWNYNNTNSYQHPIIQILLKRIGISEKLEVDSFDYKNIYERWFPVKIHDKEPSNYILNNAWNKPRDIVRLISSAQNSIKFNEHFFDQSVFDSFKKKYSIDSLYEIKEELRALYTSEEIDLIVNCFTGFKTIMSKNKLLERIENQYKNTILHEKFIQVIQDLYRLGFLGNYHPASGTYRWQHKNDEGVILNDDWRLMIHFALHSALSLGGKLDYGVSKNESLEVGDIVPVTVIKVIPSFVYVEIDKLGTKYNGSIHIGKLNMGYIKNIFDIIQEGDTFIAKVLSYNEKHKRWDLTLDHNRTTKPK